MPSFQQVLVSSSSRPNQFEWVMSEMTKEGAPWEGMDMKEKQFTLRDLVVQGLRGAQHDAY